MQQVRLFCFPYAGGNATFYRELGRYLKPGVELAAIDLKGHGMRMDEELSSCMPDVLDDVVAQMQAVGLDKPFALLGYSMGSTLAYHLYFRLGELGLKPKHIFFMANTPPYVPDDGVPSADLPDDEFLAEMASLGGLSEEVLACQELVDLFLPVMRADVRLEESSAVVEPQAIDCNMTVIYSDSDDASGRMGEWRQCAGRLCDFHRFEGTHFFMLDHYAEVANIINQAI